MILYIYGRTKDLALINLSKEFMPELGVMKKNLKRKKLPLLKRANKS